MNEIPVVVKKELIAQRLQLWRNTLYANGLDAKTAQALMNANIPDGERMLESAKAEMKKCIAAIESLELEANSLSEAV